MSASATSMASIEERRTLMRVMQKRFSWSLTLFAALLAAGAAVVSSIYSPGIDQDPQRLSGSAAAFQILGAAISTALVMRPLTHWIGGRAEESRILVLWLFFGLAFGIGTAFLTGAILPMSAAISINMAGFNSLGTLIDDLIDSLFRAPLSAFQYGVLALYSAFVVGIIYGVGGWAIDMFNRMAYPYQQPDPWVEAIGDWMPFVKRRVVASASWLSAAAPWIIAIGVGGAVFALALFGPIEFLARFRLG